MVGSKDLAMYNKKIWKRFQLEAEKRKQQEEFKRKTQELVDRGNNHNHKNINHNNQCN